MAVIVDSDTVVDPGTVMVVLGHTPGTSLAVLAAERLPDHARHAEVVLVKLPQAQELVDDGLLFGDAVQFGDIARVKYHTGRIKVDRQTERAGKEKVEQGVVRKCSFHQG